MSRGAFTLPAFLLFAVVVATLLHRSELGAVYTLQLQESVSSGTGSVVSKQQMAPSTQIETDHTSPAARVPGTEKGKPTFGDDALRRIHNLAQKNWCSTRQRYEVKYSLRWHYPLPIVANAIQNITKEAGAQDQLWWTSTGDIYMYGVAAGADGMPLVHRLFPERHIYGFDSFKGLPEEDHRASKVKEWGRGTFRAKTTPEGLVNASGGAKLATAIAGFFAKSLTSQLITEHQMRPAFYVDIDCDLHVSTKDALSWLFEHRLAREGTLFGYDDFWSLPCKRYHMKGAQVNPMEVGEGLAMGEIAKQFGVVFRCVAGPCRLVADPTSCHINNHWGPIFLVVAVNGPGGQWNSGFEMTDEEQKTWMHTRRICRAVGRSNA